MTIKLLRRISGITRQYTPITQSSGAASAGELPALNSAGKLDDTLFPDGMGADTRTAVASESLTAGSFINEYSASGTWSARLADNSNGRPATGFVKAAVASSGTAVVYPLDATNGELTGLEIGAAYYLGTAGAVTSTPLDGTDASNAGKIDQRLGVARSNHGAYTTSSTSSAGNTGADIPAAKVTTPDEVVALLPKPDEFGWAA